MATAWCGRSHSSGPHEDDRTTRLRSPSPNQTSSPICRALSTNGGTSPSSSGSIGGATAM